MKLVLGMVVGLSPGDFVLDGDPAPSPKRGWSTDHIIYTFKYLKLFYYASAIDSVVERL